MYLSGPLRLLSAVSLAALATAIRLHPRQNTDPIGRSDDNTWNITIDNELMASTTAASTNNPRLLGFVSFDLEGNWITVASPGFGFRGTYMWTSDPTAKAVLTFSGTAIHLYAPLFSGAPPSQDLISNDIKLDNEGITTTVNLTSPFWSPASSNGSIYPSVTSRVLWGTEGLANGMHNLTISMSPGAKHAVLDALVYTTTASSFVPQSASSHASSSTTLRIALASTFSVIAALIILTAVLFYRRRCLQQQLQRKRGRVDGSEIRANPGLWRWVDMRWVDGNASRTDVGGSGWRSGSGDVKGLDTDSTRMEVIKL